MKTTTSIYKSTLIYSIGNFGSRILTFLMFPLYSFYLSTAEYGNYDLILSTIALIIPVVTFQIPDCIMKFTSENDNKIVINTSIFICFVCATIVLLFGSVYLKIKGYQIILVLWVVFQIVNKFLLQITRALGKNLIYSLSSIVSTGITLLLTIIFLITLNLKIEGLIYAGIISEFLTSVYLVVVNRLWNYIELSKISNKLLKTMIVFAVPLIPNAMIWWIMNSSDKFIINHFLGSEFNGIYAISYKFPTIITILYGFYNLAWQDYIFFDASSKDFKEIIDQFFNFIFFLSIVIMFFAKIICTYFVDKAYYSAYLYIPPIIIGMIFYCFAGFFGIAYRKLNDTKKEFLSSIIGAIFNVVINILLIKYIGLWSAAISTMISFVIVFIIRYKDTKKFFNYNFFVNRNVKQITLCCIFVAFYYIDNNFSMFAVTLLSCIVFILKNRLLLKDFLLLVKK